jgi:hypothetical protein
VDRSLQYLLVIAMTFNSTANTRRAYASALAVAVAMLLVGCDARQPLVVKDPDVATPGSATGVNALPYLQAGALSDFAVAFTGAADDANNGHEGIADMGAIFTDEFLDMDTFPTRNALNERLALPTNLSVNGIFQDLGTVHNDARRALAQFALYGPTAEGRAEMYNIDAYVYILVAEHWCSGEPFSLVDIATGAVMNSPFLTTAQMLDTALAEFALAKQVIASDTAAADAALLPTQTGLATIGTARALLDLGQVAAAADTAATVAAGFIYQAYESANTLRQESGVWNYTINSQSFSVANLKNGTGLPFVTDSTDPRVPSTESATPSENGQTPFFIQQKYPTPTSNMTLGDYTEAQLIVAEGDIFGGNYAGAMTIMNTLRTNGGVTGAVGDSAAASPKDQMLELLKERAYWMYVTAHRLGDWRRMLRPPYNAAPFSFVTGDVYPIGAGIQPTLEFPTPSTTNPNPNFVACDATIP